MLAAAPVTLRTRDDLRRLLRLSDQLGWVRALEASALPGSPPARHAAALAQVLEREIDELAGAPVRHVGERGIRCASASSLRVRSRGRTDR